MCDRRDTGLRRMHRENGEISTIARFVSAGGAAFVSAVVVNPFDVVKVKLLENPCIVLVLDLLASRGSHVAFIQHSLHHTL